MKFQIRSTIALAAALALLAGCETAPTSKPSAAAAPVETRSVPTSASAGGTPATTATVAPQSRVATVDLGVKSAGGAAPTGATPTPLMRPPTVGGGAGAAAGTAVLAAPRERIVFFDFDSFVIKDDFKGLLDGHAKALSGDRGRHLVIEGHTDERGGREYNLALGQKRAEAVVKSLTLLGAQAQQLEATSFGEERPLAQGSDEAAWARNRRAELKDR
jgi:peptidoglycan-associated lipoprotein